MENVFGLVM